MLDKREDSNLPRRLATVGILTSSFNKQNFLPVGCHQYLTISFAYYYGGMALYR